MIESPLIQKVIAENTHQNILEVLKARFDTVPRDVTMLLREIFDDKKLKKLIAFASTCSDLEAFREALLA